VSSKSDRGCMSLHTRTSAYTHTDTYTCIHTQHMCLDIRGYALIFLLRRRRVNSKSDREYMSMTHTSYTHPQIHTHMYKTHVYVRLIAYISIEKNEDEFENASSNVSV